MKKIFYLELIQTTGNPFLIDVRSPKEYAHGHIPSAHLLPLFSDEERAIVGTTYKKEGKQAAIEKGLSLINLSSIIQQFKEWKAPHEVYVYCARGGMRSSSMGWLLSLLGHEVILLQGGYKAYRQEVLKSFLKEYHLAIVSGKTGVGKTAILYELKKNNQKIVDLEKLASHRGSVFGFTKIPQPTQMQFENDLAYVLNSLEQELIWVEDESKNIGAVHIPEAFYEQMKKAHAFCLLSSLNRRIGRIIDDYRDHSEKELQEAILRLQKRLGYERTQKALTFLQNKQVEECVTLLLNYYDNCYEKCFAKRDPSSFHESPYDVEKLIKIQKSVF